MNRIFLPLAVLFTLCTACNKTNSAYKTYDGFAQGGTYHITCNLSGISDSLSANLPDSLSLFFEQINHSLSGYDSTSIVSLVNRGDNPPLDKLFTETFNASKRVWEESSGYFDITGAPLFDAWGFGFKDGERVTEAMIDSILQIVGNDKARIVERDTVIEGVRGCYNFLEFDDSRMKVNFNAIAQGYTCDYIASKFNSWGMTDYLIEVGGEIYAKGVNSKGNAWRVGIDRPEDGNFMPGESLEAVIEISGQGLVTSGNYRKFYIKDGKKYSHTINPKTGYPVNHTLLSATVVAPDATTADAYATYFMVIGLDEAKEVLKNRPELGAVLIYADGEAMKEWSCNCKWTKP